MWRQPKGVHQRKQPKAFNQRAASSLNTIRRVRRNRGKTRSILVILLERQNNTNTQTNYHDDTSSKKRIVFKVDAFVRGVVALTQVENRTCDEKDDKSDNKGKEGVPLEETKSRHTISCCLSFSSRRNGLKEAQSKSGQKKYTEDEKDRAGHRVACFDIIGIAVGILHTISLTV